MRLTIKCLITFWYLLRISVSSSLFWNRIECIECMARCQFRYSWVFGTFCSIRRLLPVFFFNIHGRRLHLIDNLSWLFSHWHWFWEISKRFSRICGEILMNLAAFPMVCFEWISMFLHSEVHGGIWVILEPMVTGSCGSGVHSYIMEPK